MSGRILASSQASSELSSASFKVVSTALVGEEKPTCCRFLEKYSAVLLVVICLADLRTFSITSLLVSSSAGACFLVGFGFFCAMGLGVFLPENVGQTPAHVHQNKAKSPGCEGIIWKMLGFID